MAVNEYITIAENIFSDKSLLVKASEDKFSKPDPRSIQSILTERKNQRFLIFWSAIIWASLSLIFLFVIVSIQIYGRLQISHDFELFSGSELQIISASVFGQTLGIIYLIASKVWDNKDYIKFYSSKS